MAHDITFITFIASTALAAIAFLIIVYKPYVYWRRHSAVAPAAPPPALVSPAALVVDTHYVLSIPPGWLIGATIKDVDDEYVTLTDAVYLDGVASGSSNVSHVPLAETPAAMRSAVTRTFPLPEGMIVRREAILMAMPARISFTALIDSAAREALR